MIPVKAPLIFIAALALLAGAFFLVVLYPGDEVHPSLSLSSLPIGSVGLLMPTGKEMSDHSAPVFSSGGGDVRGSTSASTDSSISVDSHSVSGSDIPISALSHTDPKDASGRSPNRTSSGGGAPANPAQSTTASSGIGLSTLHAFSSPGGSSESSIPSSSSPSTASQVVSASSSGPSSPAQSPNSESVAASLPGSGGVTSTPSGEELPPPPPEVYQIDLQSSSLDQRSRDLATRIAQQFTDAMASSKFPPDSRQYWNQWDWQTSIADDAWRHVIGFDAYRQSP